MIFTSSQNLRFSGPVACEYSDSSEQALVIGDRLQAALTARGYKIVSDEIGYEFDCSFAVETSDAGYSIAVVPTAEHEVWMLQLICTSEPGWLRQLLGWKAVNRGAELYEIAIAIHEALTAQGFAQLRWKLDEYPGNANSSAIPERSGN